MKEQNSTRPSKRTRSNKADGESPHSTSDVACFIKDQATEKTAEDIHQQTCSSPAKSRAKRFTNHQVTQPATEENLGSSGSFPIVGIGASAGGLEALEKFLKNVPEQSGMAFVVIQHLDPSLKDAMVELLQRVCAIPVIQVKGRHKVKPNCVYVIPPNKDLSIMHGVLHLLPQTSPGGLNLPIDFFFRSLAEDQQERSIGVVLSGMGSDGTLGLRAIKEKAGAGFAQALSSAKFDGMPRSIIEAGLADMVATAEDLPAKIIAYHQHAPYSPRPDISHEEKQQNALEKIFILLRAQTGNDFSLYKRSTIYRRIERRMNLHQIDNMANYVRYLRENPQEMELLFKELLIGVTNFFRDPPAWEHLRSTCLPELFQMRSQNGVLRAWVPGCSTGEEAYSLAIVFREALDQIRPARSITLQIFATDLDKEAIEKARQGIYPANIVADVSSERLRRFFIQDEHGYRVSKEIRETVVFAPQNIIMDPPFTKLDILSCRNLLIYLSPELQKKLIPIFHYSLNPGGILFLGSAETIGSFSSLFEPLDSKTRLYRRLEMTVNSPAVEFPCSFPALTGVTACGSYAEPLNILKTPPNLQSLADRVIVQQFSPTAIFTNSEGDIIYLSSRTGKYLEPPVGKANLNIFAMAREGLRYELSRAFSAALREEQPVTVRSIKVKTNGATQTIDLTIQKLTDPKELRGTVMIVIMDAPTSSETAEPGKTRRRPINIRLMELERELQHAREEVQSTREEMQTSQEELTSTNEELQSTNEELQSTNEELTTSKEEMQSMNEELETVNHELQSKVDELSRSNNDMKNLLNSTDIATLFLDSQLLVRRFTTQTAKLIKLIPADAGRPITDIATDLDYPDLVVDAREVLQSLVFKEKIVATYDGRWFTVRIMPYRTLENVIDGLVITFTDTTTAKVLEMTLKEQANQLRQMAESLPSPVWSCRPDGACDYLSQQWIEYTGIPEEDQLGYGWLEQIHPDDRERVREEWKAAVKSGLSLNTEFRIRAKDSAFRWFKTRSSPIRNNQGMVVKWYGTHTDVDDLKQAAEARQALAELLSSILDWINEFQFFLDSKGIIIHYNSTVARNLQVSRHNLLGKNIFDIFPEAAGSVFEEKYRKAIRNYCVMSFEMQFTQAPYAGYYNVLIHPQTEYISVLFQRQSEPAHALTDEEVERKD